MIKSIGGYAMCSYYDSSEEGQCADASGRKELQVAVRGFETAVESSKSATITTLPNTDSRYAYDSAVRTRSSIRQQLGIKSHHDFS